MAHSDTCIQQQLEMSTELVSSSLSCNGSSTALKLQKQGRLKHYDKQPNHTKITSSICDTSSSSPSRRESILDSSTGTMSSSSNAKTQLNHTVDTRGMNLGIFQGEPGRQPGRSTQQHDQVLIRLVILVGIVLQS